MAPSRKIYGVMCLTGAAVVIVFWGTFAYALSSEYGMSPNGDFLYDFANGFLLSIPVLLLLGLLIWGGIRLAVPRWRRHAGRVAAGALVAVILVNLAVTVWGDHTCRAAGRSCGHGSIGYSSD
jgi:hypothetical protein